MITILRHDGNRNSIVAAAIQDKNAVPVWCYEGLCSGNFESPWSFCRMPYK